FICNPLNTEIFSNAIIQLLENNELAKKMGEMGMLRAKEEYSFERMTNQYCLLYAK
ncbi:MAG: glycosyl transferase, partial [Candidatus Kerfeldbacteria bacterium CG_4_10_14_0_8_um_filter_42_10]